VLITVSPIFGAFEGLTLFQPVHYSSGLITPLTLSPAAHLSDSPVWASVGRGNLLNQKWADFNTITVGGRWDQWRGSGSVWSSGDELYRESIGTVAFARPIGKNIVGGLSLAHAWVQIKDAAVVEPQNSLGLSATGRVGRRIGFTLSYDGLRIGSQSANRSFTRQEYRVGLQSYTPGFLEWAMNVSKTPGFALRYGAGVQLSLIRNVSVDLGYRTNPAMPHFSACFSLGRLALSIRVIHHDIFGISKGFGLSFK
jgi:opacity protein-like surface antigen